MVSELNKNAAVNKKIGESWEISAVQDEVSVLANGSLAGNNLQELIEIYMGELVGEQVYDKYGMEFPLLIKFIDANDVLSIQVHPDDELAKERHMAYGKTEMWYVLEADTDSVLYTGFSGEVTKETYLEHVEKGTLHEIMNIEKVSEGDVFFIPAGRVHAIGKGIVLAEIQQTSDITYRISDWNRTDQEGNPRELHTDLALDAIDFKKYDSYKTLYKNTENENTTLISCDYFTTNLLEFTKQINKDYNLLDSFVVIMCIGGSFSLLSKGETSLLKKGETILIPAETGEITLIPEERAKILEVFYKNIS